MTDGKSKGPRACNTCARAKSRCVPGPVANICERCHRLNKPCGLQIPAPPRRRPGDDGAAGPARAGTSRHSWSSTGRKTTRVADLERRLEDLTWRMDAVARQASPSTSTSMAHNRIGPPGTPGGPPRLACKNMSRHIFPSLDADGPWMAVAQGTQAVQQVQQPSASSVSDGVSPSTTTVTMTTTTTTPATTPETNDSLSADATTVDNSNNNNAWPQGDEAERLLLWFRRNTPRLVPFVVVPAHIGTAAQLQAERPFLWKAAMMVALHLEGARQTWAGGRLLVDLVAGAFLGQQGLGCQQQKKQHKCHQAVDMLQGLLLWMAWYHFNAHSAQLSHMLFLARSLCALVATEVPGAGDEQERYSSESLEIMRAYAGTYYVVSAITATARKPDALAATDALDRYCAVLARQQEHATDRLLAQLVRVQQLGQAIAVAYQGTTSDKTSTMDVVRRLEQQVAAFRAQLPPDLADEPGLVGHVQIAETMLYEVGMQDGASISLSDRLLLLEACKTAVKRFMVARFAPGVGDVPPFACLTAFDYIYAFLTSLRLMSYRLPGAGPGSDWSTQQVRRDLDFDAYLDLQIDNMQQLAVWRSAGGVGKPVNSKTVGTDNNDLTGIDAFARLAIRMDGLRTLIQRELDKLADERGGSSSSSSGARVAVDMAPLLPNTAPTPTPTLPTTLSAEAFMPFPSMFLAASAKSSNATNRAIPAALPVTDTTIPGLTMDTSMLDMTDPFAFSDAAADFIQGMDMSWPDMLNGVLWDDSGLDVVAVPSLYGW